ncbi:heavy metal sensor histidine kinase [Arenimonas maotaiensis]|nr:heavy metal sensor histidine kinase [Arenimonas maotaiensis]
MPGRLPLTARLGLFFTAVAVLVVLGLGWLFITAADRHFAELDHAALQDKKHLIEDLLSTAGSVDATRRRLEDALGHHHGLTVSILTPDGAPLFRSKGFPDRNSIRDAAGHGHAERPDSRLRVMRFTAAAGYAPDAELNITLAMDTSHHVQFITELRHSLSLYAVAATLLSGMLGLLAAHQGLAPLRAMKARAAAVSGQRLDERMPVESVPVEMADLADELNRMLDRLQRDFRKLQDFSSDLAHELRTPIANLLTQTQVTLSAERDTSDYREVLASNVEELQRLARMVSDMLFLAKTEHGVELPSKERFWAMPEVLALFDFYDVVAEEKRIALVASGDGEIDGDRLMFRRAVSNLMSNALRHTPDGGRVSVQVTASPDSTEIVVENTGQGVDPKVLPRLFDRFFRADPSRAHAEADGSGLGLSITKAIVESHGGSVTVESDNGKTLFLMSFPMLDKSRP